MPPVPAGRRKSLAATAREEAAVEGEASGAARAIDSYAEPASARSGPNPAKMKYKSNRIALNRQDPGYSVLRSRFITLSVSSGVCPDSASSLALSKKKDFFFSSKVPNLLLPI